MKEHYTPLALAFMKSHPDAAAHILEQSDVVYAAHFIASAPEDYRTPVLERLLPHYAARMCKTLPVDIIVMLLMPLEAGRIASILRFFGKKDRAAILNELPSKTKATSRLLLKFSQDTVGAWMTPHAATAMSDNTVIQTISMLMQDDRLVHTDCIFVINREHQLKGRLYYIDMMSADPDQLISSLMHSETEMLAGRMAIDKAERHEAWGRYDVMPVINRDKKFVGALRHVDLRKGLTYTSTQIAERAGQDLLTGISGVYGYALIALFHAMGNVVHSDMQQ